jgi:hypothetical protein
MAIELRKAGALLQKIRKQLEISRASLKRVLAYAHRNPSDPVSHRKKEPEENMSSAITLSAS